jgi:transposase InsO family protein/transposase-like protein
VSHRNARTNEFARLLIAQRVLAGHKPGEVAKQLGVSRQTVYKWVRRYQAEGTAGLADRSSRPCSSPRRTSEKVTARITAARVKHFAGPVALSGMLKIPASTIGAVLRREGLPRLSDVDRVTGEIVRGGKFSDQRYEHREPGSLLHVDVKKLGRIPKGGGWRVHGRGHDDGRGKGGWDFVHVAIDDHSRVAYCEVLADEKGLTCAAFLHRAAHWFHDTHHVTIRRVLTDNAMSYRYSADWIAVCRALQIKRRFIKPHCPWTNGKAERLNRTLVTEWAYSRSWTYNHQRTRALDNYLRHYNTQRGHSALGGRPPISRLAA